MMIKDKIIDEDKMINDNKDKMIDDEKMKMKGGWWKCQIQYKVAFQRAYNRIYCIHLILFE